MIEFLKQILTWLVNWLSGKNEPVPFPPPVSQPTPVPVPVPVPPPADLKPKVDRNLISTCPNHNDGRFGIKIDTLVLHNTEGSMASAIARFQDEGEQVSAHLIIDRDGTTVQMVDFSNTAWHAGDRTYNRRSIGIENVASQSEMWLTTLEEQKLVAWCRYLMKTFGISIKNVIPHRAIVSTSCPGSIWIDDKSFEEWKQKHLA